MIWLLRTFKAWSELWRCVLRKRGWQAMRRLKRAVALAVSSFCLAGCAIFAVDMAPDRPDQPWHPATTVTGEIIPGAKSLPDSTGPGYVLPTHAEVAAGPPPPPLVYL